MKRLILVVACLVCALAVAAPVSAVTLTSADMIGYLINGTPSGDHDAEFASQLISMYNSGPASYTALDVAVIPPPPGQTNDFYVVPGGNVPAAPLPGVIGTGVTDESAPFFPIDLTGTTYDYLYAKFGGFGALFWLDDYTSIDGITLAPPAGVEGGGLSHVVLLNPTQVPEAGALIMFASGLIGLVGYRRMRRMQ